MIATIEELESLTGIIYIIKNKINWKRYIGQSVNAFYGRYNRKWNETHRLNRHLLNSVNKYGIENFEVEIILKNQSIDELNYWETFYIKYFKSNDKRYGYNIREGGENGGKINEDAKLYASLRLRMTKEEFIERSRKIHGDKLDYSLVEIGWCSDKVTLRCIKHDITFKQNTSGHFRTATGGCDKCRREFLSNIRTIPFSEVLDKSRSLHEDKYEYLEDTFHHGKRKLRALKLKCNKCSNIFKIIVQNHLNPNGMGGCKKCALKSNKQNNPLPFQDFCNSANKKHNNEFTYFQEGYKDCFSVIKIIHKNCNTEFFQSVERHMKYKIACPCCAAKDRLNRVRSIDKIDENNNTINRYKSRKIAARECNLNIQDIDSAAKNNSIYAGFRWKYVGKDYEFKNIKCNKNKEYNYYV